MPAAICGGSSIRCPAWIEAHADDPALAEFVQPLGKAFGRLQQTTAELARRGLADPTEAAAGATDYLRLFGLTALAWVWARAAEVSLPHAENDPFYRAKLATARFYMQKILAADGGADVFDHGGGSYAETVRGRGVLNKQEGRPGLCPGHAAARSAPSARRAVAPCTPLLKASTRHNELLNLLNAQPRPNIRKYERPLAAHPP